MLRLFVLQALVLALVAYLYIEIGLGEGYIYTMWWFDIVLHILGSVWSALSITWLLSLFGVRPSIWIVLAFVLLVGLLWEGFEYFFHIGGSNFMSYRADTVKDITDDCIGGVLGWLLIRLLTRTSDAR